MIRETLFNMGWGTDKWEAEEWNRVKERVLEDEKDRQWKIEQRNGE